MKSAENLSRCTTLSRTNVGSRSTGLASLAVQCNLPKSPQTPDNRGRRGRSPRHAGPQSGHVRSVLGVIFHRDRPEPPPLPPSLPTAAPTRVPGPQRHQRSCHSALADATAPCITWKAIRAPLDDKADPHQSATLGRREPSTKLTNTGP